MIQSRLNEILIREGISRLLITVVSIAIDLHKGTLWCFNSAHPSSIVVDKNGRISQLMSAVGTPILGFGADFPKVTAKKAQLHPGDYVVLYTDGISPLMKPFLRSIAGTKTHPPEFMKYIQSAQGLRDHLTSRLDQPEYNELKKNDDITLAVLQFKGSTAQILESYLPDSARKIVGR